MPPLHPVFFPKLRRFISFTIDPVAAVAHIDNPELHAAARAMKPKRYLANVGEVREFRVLVFDFLTFPPQLDTLNLACEWIQFRLAIVTRGPIDADATRGIEAEMCTPIFPETRHPSDRQPLRATSVSWVGRQRDVDLPFPNCYLHSSDATFAEVRVKNSERYDWRRFMELSRKESSRLTRLVDVDYRREKALLAEIRAATNESTVEAIQTRGDEDLGADNALEVAVAESNPEKVDEDRQEMNSGVRDAELAKSSDGFSDIYALNDVNDFIGDPRSAAPSDVGAIFEFLVQGRAPEEKVVPITNITYDIWSYPNFADAKEFHEEAAQLWK